MSQANEEKNIELLDEIMMNLTNPVVQDKLSKAIVLAKYYDAGRLLCELNLIKESERLDVKIIRKRYKQFRQFRLNKIIKQR